jgi:hypothetical protein
MSVKDEISECATLVEQQPQAFDYVHRIALERALFALVSDFALTEFEIAITGFSDEMVLKLEERCHDVGRSEAPLNTLKQILEKIQLISSGDPYITLEGKDVTLEGRGEVISSLGLDLRNLVKEIEQP